MLNREVQLGRVAEMAIQRRAADSGRLGDGLHGEGLSPPQKSRRGPDGEESIALSVVATTPFSVRPASGYMLVVHRDLSYPPPVYWDTARPSRLTGVPVCAARFVSRRVGGQTAG